MSLIQFAYASRPFGFDAGMLNGILFDARDRNRRDDITGVLVCRADLYLQLLEGPELEVMRCFGRISRDDRHCEVYPLVRRETERRLFAGWSMRDDAARSWMWTIKEVADGAVERASAAEVMAVFQRLAGERRIPAGAPA